MPHSLEAEMVDGTHPSQSIQQEDSDNLDLEDVMDWLTNTQVFTQEDAQGGAREGARAREDAEEGGEVKGKPKKRKMSVRNGNSHNKRGYIYTVEQEFFLINWVNANGRHWHTLAKTLSAQAGESFTPRMIRLKYARLKDSFGLS